MAERLHPLVEQVCQENWNDGGLIRPDHWDEWIKLSIEDQALYLAARVGCPLAKTFMKERDPKELRDRYGRIDLWYGFLKDQMAGTPLEKDFGAPVDWTYWAEIGKHDQGWVPEKGKNIIQGPETYHGYVLTRQLLDVLAKDPDQVFKAISRIRRCKTLDNAVVSMYFFCFDLGYDLNFVEKRVFSAGYQQEKPPEYWRPIFKRINERLAKSSEFWKKLEELNSAGLL